MLNASRILSVTKQYLREKLGTVGVSQPEQILQIYATPPGARTKSEFFDQLVGSAANRQMGPNVLANPIKEKKEQYDKILFSFDPEKVEANWGTRGSAALLQEFREKQIAPPRRADARRSGYWEGYCKTIIDAAAFVNSTDIDKFRTDISANELAKIGAIALLQARIFGFGVALAADALKESGLVDTVKPDTHIIKLAALLGWPEMKDLALVIRVNEFCAAGQVSPYQLDKMVWLVYSKNFYRLNDANISEEQRITLAKTISEDEWSKRLQ